jgi:hypothetical protein
MPDLCILRFLTSLFLRTYILFCIVPSSVIDIALERHLYYFNYILLWDTMD